MKKTALFLIGLSLLSRALFAADLLVTAFTDDIQDEGTLRRVLMHACDKVGDDTVAFDVTHLPEIRIQLVAPLVIPEECDGTVRVTGSSQVETILDGLLFISGGQEAGDSCILNIYGDGHTVEHFTFVHNRVGAALCLFGNRNIVTDNLIGVERDGNIGSNKYGIVISDIFQHEIEGALGEENQIIKNHIARNTQAGIWIEGSRNAVKANKILYNSHCQDIWIPGQPACVYEGWDLAWGIEIVAGQGNLIGGPRFPEDANTIQFNQGGGVRLIGDPTSIDHTISKNIIHQNYGSEAAIDLLGDGVTLNDWLDMDRGPNEVINTVDHFQTFPVVGGYWTWGIARSGAKVELYDVSGNDRAQGRTHGGAQGYFGDVAVVDKTYEIFPDGKTALPDGAWVTTLLFSDTGSTSEFSLNLPVGPDRDFDGIIDALETGDGTPTSASTDASLTDTDGDLLPDAIEDKNRNGVWDQSGNETQAFNADTDGDELSDWAEMHGDGEVDPRFDTDPFTPDTDGDGLLDGAEDRNTNGLWETHLGETSPLLVDSDGDGLGDAIDNCPAIPNPGQEPWFCGR